MGAWDYGPFDNDDASDFWWELRTATNPMKVLRARLNDNRQGYELERRAAAVIVEFLGRFDRRTLNAMKKDAKKALEELLSGDWVDTWDEPPKIRRELRKEIKRLQ